MKHNNIHVIGKPEGEEEQGVANLFEKVMTENFPNLMRVRVMQIHKIHRVRVKMNPKEPIPRHIIIKMANSKANRKS